MTAPVYEETPAFFSDLFDELFPILRSITGPGVRESYDILCRYIPFERHQVKTDTKVFDWTVPPEWHCDDAYLIGPEGEKIVDITDNNLHVLNYSEAVDQELSLEELQPHLYSIEHLPDAIPYVTSYYSRRWGFCLSHRQRQSLKDGPYRAVIKSRFETDGGVDLLHTTLPGRSDREILLTSYMCHPSLANNELSGPLVLLGVYQRIQKWTRRNHRFRFAIHPETIGSLCLLHLFHEEMRAKTDGGLIVNCIGGHNQALTYKFSKKADGVVDKAIQHMQKHHPEIRSLAFTPNAGADERQYNMPGFNIPVCNASRDFYFEGYEGYHNSLDTKEFMQIDQILNAIDDVEKMLKLADNCIKYENLVPFGEPQLGPRGLYPVVNFVGKSRDEAEKAAHEELCQIKWLLTLSDGDHDLIDIADTHGCEALEMLETLQKLEEKGLLAPYI